MFKIIFAGIDIGSTTSKAVLIDENKEVLNFSVIHTSFNRDKSGQDVLDEALKKICLTREDVKYILSTGYGRRSLTIANKVLPEIICHSTGTKFLYPDVRTIIDIGGQDSKAISLDEKGMITKFEMNDKCAAGTGRFFEVLTDRLLNVPMDELGPLSLESKNPSVISSMCTIFAETEIISFLSEGVAKEDIAAGMAKSIAKRVVAMGRAGQIKYEEPIIFSGGVAKNVGVTKAFEEILGKKVNAITNPQETAALGAALAGLAEYNKKK